MNIIRMNCPTHRQQPENDALQTGVSPPSLRSARKLDRQHGLTLVELMVALVISSFLMIGLVQIFITSRTTYQVDEGLARLQENGRFAIDYLVRDLRMAGNMGCLGKIPPDKQEVVWNYLKNVTTGSPFDVSTGIGGYEATGTAPGATYVMPGLYPPTNVFATTPALDPATVGGAIAGTDVLAVRFMDGNAVPLANVGGKYHNLTEVFADASATSLDQVYDIKDKTVVVVANCKQAAVFQVTNALTGASPVSLVHDLSGNLGNSCAVWKSGGCKGYEDAFQAGSMVGALRSRFYFVARNSRGAAPADGPSLFRRDAGLGQPTELVEGVENMQILYGIDSNTGNDTGRDGHGADRYLTANNVTNWSRVVSVRIGLLVSTINSAGKADTSTDTSTYTVAGVTLNVAGVDQNANGNLRRRRVFTTTIGLRNL